MRRLLIAATAIAGALGGTVAAPVFPGGRRLEDSATFEYNDLSTYSVVFEKCQFVKAYEDEVAEDEDNDTPLATKHFVVYRLCPSDSCENSCEENYGTYVVEVDTYLQTTIEYQTQAFEDMCDNCDEKCNEDGGYCSGCGLICYNYENLENNGYVDAAQFVECQELEYGDDDGLQLYIGPTCSSGGDKIAVGLFSDENCWEPYTDLDVEEVLGGKLSYHLLSHASKDEGTVCLTCLESNDDEDEQNDQDQADYDDVNEMCENLYYAAAKCESKTGLEGGFVQTNREDQDYENQVENEFMACTFINSLLWGSYTETGEIDIDSKRDVVIQQATPLQILSLSLLSLSLVGLAGAIVYLRRRIDTQFPDTKTSFVANPGGQLA
ncbi:expressed unknown protein [Seminavis robusta]|uniref:Uncharacterized protein n=1 Tax=Seminavis robusta TaxID=568900 RepID=A0A9N8HLM5_9STRA|nr:expressed unknown protein [Seminavis robusta]|eukprot:Sro834_g208660.1 n/a (380) ;mRNA; f:13617-14756